MYVLLYNILKIPLSPSIHIGASVKVIQLLQHFEQLSTVFAQAVSVWSTEYGIRAIVGEVIRLVTFFKKNFTVLDDGNEI